MSLDRAKYERLFLEETSEYLAEMSQSLLSLEKDDAFVESVDTIFRLAHSIKSMAASVGQDDIAIFAHGLEDRMQAIRTRGSLSDSGELSLLFRALSQLEEMIRSVHTVGATVSLGSDVFMALKSAGPDDSEPAHAGAGAHAPKKARS
ncbi:MAG: Hpt domain-containing protein [Myxococcota bacterium]|nr:Hpt domain-containing protein [Myxococcota bacterium]